MPVSLQKIRREAVPLLFFGTVVSIKAWFLFSMLVLDGGLDKMGHLLHAQGLPGDYHQALIMDMVSYVAYNVIAILFDSLVFVSYLMRTEPQHKAQGFSQTIFPMATVLLPVVGFTLLAIPTIRDAMPNFDVGGWMRDYQLSPLFPVLLDVAGLSIGLLGVILSFIALWSLRRSFSLMSEVRELVSNGLYQRIRHPLYMAEIIHILGVALLSGTPVGLYLFAVALAMQIVRAKVEEHKFLAAVPEYAEFQARTGFLWPKIW